MSGEAEEDPLLVELQRAEREALARLRRRYHAIADRPAQLDAGAVPISTFREQEQLLEQYVKFHDAVRASAAWKVLQRVRRVFGREW